MATAKEMRALKGKIISYKSNKTRLWLSDKWTGEVTEQLARETCIEGDWHDTKSIEVLEVIEP